MYLDFNHFSIGPENQMALKKTFEARHSNTLNALMPGLKTGPFSFGTHSCDLKTGLVLNGLKIVQFQMVCTILTTILFYI
jgi:hypothetical protein